jgi:hypothetical protein
MIITEATRINTHLNISQLLILFFTLATVPGYVQQSKSNLIQINISMFSLHDFRHQRVSLQWVLVSA